MAVLGFCFATAGPGAFNLLSGMAVAMSDSYAVLAVTGYASLDWKGRGSLNETSGLARTPNGWRIRTHACRSVWAAGNPLVLQTMPGVSGEQTLDALSAEVAAGRVGHLAARTGAVP